MALCPGRHREIPKRCQVLDKLPNNYEKRRLIMAKQDVLYTKEDSIGIITLNRAEKLNALTHEMLRTALPCLSLQFLHRNRGPS
jgi:hypothetical protein